MRHRPKIALRLLATFTLVAVVLAASVPFYCSTGWCCSKHQVEQKQTEHVPSCCSEITQPVTIQAADDSDCCGGGGIQSSDEQQPLSDNSCAGGCPTGCCKIAAMPYVLAPVMSIASLYPVAMLAPVSAIDTGIELSDYIPQPPRVFSA